MGYSTQFKGELKFTQPLNSEALGYLNSFMGVDRRNLKIPDQEIYPKYGDYWYHIDYQLIPDFSGIRWNNSEKSYNMEHIANFLIDKMQEKYPQFGLTGKMVAQGDDVDDRWELIIKDGRAINKKVIPTGDKITCPHCDTSFYLE